MNHVHRAWKKKLREIVKDKEKCEEMYQGLHVLMEETDESKFYALLKCFQLKWEDQYPEFSTYFEKNYSKRAGKYNYHKLKPYDCFIIHR